jgi:hypothetical protein
VPGLEVAPGPAAGPGRGAGVLTRGLGSWPRRDLAESTAASARACTMPATLCRRGSSLAEW